MAVTHKIKTTSREKGRKGTVTERAETERAVSEEQRKDVGTEAA